MSPVSAAGGMWNDPSGQWNELRILCQGEVIETRLNGELINRATKVWPREGKILVQCEGSEIFIRKLAVRFVP
jgi:hypothetical protein